MPKISDRPSTNKRPAHDRPREGADASVEGLTVTGDQRGGLSGVAKPGAVIEAINLSAAPKGRLKLTDTTAIATADARGHFSDAKLTGEQTIAEGDWVRLRARAKDGSTTDWMTLQASGLASRDARNAEVALFRIGLEAQSGGKVAVTNINEKRQVSEPGATLRLTNTRTGVATDVVITDEGGFPKGFTVKGKPGDEFTVAASDGTNNADFATVVGAITVPEEGAAAGGRLADPALHKNELRSDGSPRFATKPFSGPLFVDGPKASDPIQGQLGNCYVPAALAAVAHFMPDAIKALIKPGGDGTYEVTFKVRNEDTGKVTEKRVKVDGDLWVRSSGEPLYGRSANSGDPATMELWFPLVEKAYAAWKGSYDVVGSGGSMNEVFEAVTGKDTGSMMLGSGMETPAWNLIREAVDGKRPIGAGTHDGQPELYTNTGVYGDHAYSIVGYEKRGKERLVVLRNPWGESEPAGHGENDGVFTLPIERFVELFQMAYRVDE